ncbi:MAG: DUF4416 family protein [Bacteriovoracaceae bacterium]|nr:DUF4416 family protein [Bacteriovoracaceae bacterium]
MSSLSTPTPSFLFGSFLFNSKKISKAECLKLWTNKYQVGEEYIPVNNPLFDYYSKEMGEKSELERFFIIDFRPQPREVMLAAKIWAQNLEDEYAHDKKRTINLDIGLLSLENFILATGKPYVHRVYLGQGIYADLTYMFQNKTFSTFPWTYPDYADPEKIKIFNQWRAKLLNSI